MDQAQVEALYSQRNNHTMLHNEIKAELEGIFAPIALKLFLRIDSYLEKSYYPSKAARIAELREDAKHKSSVEKWIVAIIAAVIHTKKTQTIQQTVGYLSNHIPHENPFARATTAGELLALGASKGGLYEIQRNGSGESATIKVNHWDYLDRHFLHIFDWINDTQFNPPLIEPPKEVKNNYSCGYHTIQEPCILGTYTMHDGKICLDTINTLNRIEWILDPDVLAEPEVPSKPLKTAEAREQFVHMAAQSQRVYAAIKDRPFYLVWQADCRGRYYSHGYHVNLQAQEYKKALLNFNHKEVLT
jgi:hypothetical protein